MQKTDGSAYLGLPWPETYQEILPAIRELWGIEGNIYLNRKLSGGRSGALVYAADIESAQFTGQAILKLDQGPDPASRERHEAELHRQAIADAPDFAARHLPKLLHTLHHNEQIAVLSTIAGRGLEYAKPWNDCPFEQQLEVVRRVSRGLLEDWNKDYRRQQGLRQPQELLRSWLGHRLDPAQGGRLHGFLSKSCGLSPSDPSVTFEGHWYPNPIAFALGARELPDHLRLRMITGHCHGDLHALNVLVGQPQSPEPDYYLIDLALYQSEQYLLYDHAYFEMAYLLNSRANAGTSSWESILRQLCLKHYDNNGLRLRSDDIGLIELVKALRQEAKNWIDRHEGDRLSYMESQYLLARVAAGLNFANKDLPDGMRRMAFLYAASNLKDYLKLNQVNWPKHGPHFVLDRAAPSVETAAADEAMTGQGPTERPTERPAAGLSAPGVPARSAERDEAQQTRAGGLFRELQRRHVIKVAGLYLIVAWLCVQVAVALKAALTLPLWTDTLVTLLLALGFPVACIIAWAFELSPEGLQRTRPAARDDPGPTRRKDAIDYVVLAGIVAILLFTLGQRGLDYFDSEPSPIADAGGPPSIAVLPFRNLSPDGSNDTFSDGLTIEIMTTLARTGQFRIPGQTSSFRYKNQPEDLRVIGQDLGVQYILEGSVRRSGNDLRVEAQLIEADDGFLVWSDAFVDQVVDIFVIQEKIANAIGSALKTPLGITAGALETERSDNPQAYALFLEALVLLEERGPQLSRTVELLQRSVNLDPDFAAGWAALSLAYDVLPVYVKEFEGRPVVPAGMYRRAQNAALQAQQLDPDDPIVQQAVGNLYRRQRQWTAAEDQYRRSLDTNPGDPAVMKDYSEVLTIVGHFDQAFAMAEQMIALDPLNALYEFRDALLRWQLVPDEANFNVLVAFFEEHPTFQPFSIRPVLGHLVKAGQLERLEALLRDCASCDRPWAGRALEMVREAQTEPPTAVFDKYKDELFVGYTFLDAIGGTDLILEAFQYYALKTDRLSHIYAVPWGVVDKVGKTEEFKDLVRDMGLPAYWQERGWPDRCRPLEGDDFECG